MTPSAWSGSFDQFNVMRSPSATGYARTAPVVSTQFWLVDGHSDGWSETLSVADVVGADAGDVP